MYRSAITLALAFIISLGATTQAQAQSFELYPEASQVDLALDQEWDRAESLGKVAIVGGAQLGLQYVALMALQPPNWQDHGNSLAPSWGKFTSNFRRAPVWDPQGMGGGGALGYLQADGDSWVTNVVGHGLQGSEVHLRMRQEGFSPLQAFAAGALHSTVWEYGVEGWNETPSLWDLLYTPIGGFIMGELRHFLTQRVKRLPGESNFERGALFMIDPLHIVF